MMTMLSSLGQGGAGGEGLQGDNQGGVGEGGCCTLGVNETPPALWGRGPFT